MSQNKEDLKNKIIYRASYRGTKEMDILMLAFVKSIIYQVSDDNLEILDKFVNMDDQSLLSIRNNESLININDENMYAIVKKFQQFKM
tara:strand:- start:45 stop:308 length:264 start_codon:yes stop_codon:yes gene_type:complete